MFCDYRNESGLHPIGDQKNYFKSFWMKDERDRRKKKTRRRERRRKEKKRKKEEQFEESRPVVQLVVCWTSNLYIALPVTRHGLHDFHDLKAHLTHVLWL